MPSPTASPSKHLTGKDLSTEAAFDAFFNFYMQTGSRKWGSPYLTARLLFMRRRDQADDILLGNGQTQRPLDRPGAINFIGSDTIGRHWCTIEHLFLRPRLRYRRMLQRTRPQQRLSKPDNMLVENVLPAEDAQGVA